MFLCFGNRKKRCPPVNPSSGRNGPLNKHVQRQPVISLSHTLILTQTGRVFACGSNTSGQLGVGDKQSRSSLTLVLSPVKFVSVCGGEEHSLGLTQEGTVWIWGQFGPNQSFETPNLFTEVKNIQAICAGSSFSLFLDMSGDVWCFGMITGPLLHGRLDCVNRIQMISAGNSHALALDIHGVAWAIGFNVSGQLGLGDADSRNCLSQISDLPTARHISAGDSHNLVIDLNGNLWGFGYNYYQQLGLRDKLNKHLPVHITWAKRVTNAICIGHSSFVQDSRGLVWVFGCNYFGQLGIGTALDRQIPVVNLELPSFQSILGGGRYTLFVLDSEGGVSSCGFNGRGVLGHGDFQERYSLELIAQFPFDSSSVVRVKSARSGSVSSINSV